jgi:hypothetical protein
MDLCSGTKKAVMPKKKVILSGKLGLSLDQVYHSKQCKGKKKIKSFDSLFFHFCASLNSEGMRIDGYMKIS